MGCCLCPKKPKNENDPSANIEKNNEGESGEVISDAAAEEHDDSKRDNGTLNTEQDQTNSLNKHQGPDVSTSAPFPSESSDQPLVSSDVDSLNLLPLVTSGHLSPNPEKETSVTSVVKNPKKIKKSSMQQEEDQAQGQGFNPILPQNGPPVFAVPFPYFVPCSKCGSNEKNYLQQMSARPTPNTLANNYAVHSSLSHEVHDGIEQTFAQAYMGPPGSSPFNNMNFIKMHPTNDPKDTSIQTEDHNKNKFADNKNKFADHNIYSDIPNFPDSSQVPNKAGEQHPKRHITFLSQERQFNNDNQTDQSCQTQRRSSSVNEQYPYQDRSSVSQEQPETTVNQPRAYNKMPMQGYKHRGKGKTLVEDTTFFREDMKVVRHREISIWSRDKDSVKIPVPSRELFNILDRELEVHMQANRSREQSPEVKRARTRNNSRSPKTVQFSLTPDVDPLTDVYDEEGMYSMEEDNLLGRYENEAEMRREQTYRQKGQGMQILLGSPSTSNMPPSFSRSPKSTTTSPNLSRSPSPIARSPTPLVTPRSQRKVSYSLSCSAGTSSPPVELEASISPQSLSSRSTSSQTDNVEEQTPPLKNQPYNDLVRNSNLETGMLHLYKTMNELLLSKILLEQKLENLTEEIKLQRLQSDDEERHAKRTEKVEYNSNDEYYTITKEECLIGVTESSTGNLNWEPQSSQSNQNGEVKESIQGLSHKVDQMEAERHELKAQLENIQSKIDRIIALQKSRKLESITEHECSSDHSRAIHHQHLTTSAQYVYQSAEGHISEHGKRKPSLEVTSGRRKSSALQDDKLPKLPDFVKMSPDSGRSSPLMFTGQPSDEENPESGQRFHDDNQSSNDYEPCQNSNQDVSDIDKDVYQNTFFPQASESHVPENKSSNQGDTPPINGERRNHDSRKVDSTPGTSEDESVMCCHCVLEDQSEVIQNPSEKQMMNESNESTPGSYQRDWIIKEMLHQLLEDTSEQSHSDLNQQKTKGESRNQSATDIIKSCVKEINTDQCIKDIGTKNNVRDNIQHSVKDMSTQYGVRDTSAQPSLLSAKDTSTHLNIRETSTQLSRDSMTDVSTQYRVREMSTQRYAVSGQDTSTQQSVKDNSAQQSAHSLKDTSTQQSVKDNSAQQSAHSLKDTSTQHSVRDTSAQHCRLIISDTSTQYSVRDMCTQHNTVSMQDTRTQQSVRDTSTQHSLKVTSTQQSVRDTSTQHSVHSLKDTSTQQSVRATSTQHSVHRLQEARTQHCFNNMSTQRNSLSMKDMSIQQSVRDTSAQHSVHNLKDMSTQHCVRDMSTQRSILSTKDMSTQQSVRDTSTQCSVHSLKDVSTQHCVRDMSTQHSILSMKDMSTQQSVRDTSTQHSVHNLKDTSTQQNVRDTQHSVRILKDVSTQHCFSNMSTQCSILSMKGLSSQQSVTDANKQYSVLNVKDPSTKEIVKKLSTEFRMNSLQDISTQQNMKYTSTQSMKDFRPQDNMSTQQRLREAKRLDDLKDIKNISKEQSPPKLTRTFHSLRDLSSKSGKDKSIQQRPRTVSVPNNFRESLSKSTKYMNREQTPHQPSKNYFQSMPMHAIKETSNENIFRQGSSGLSIEKMHEQNEQVIGNGQPRQQFDRRQSYIPTSLDMLDNPRESSTQNFQEINAKYISRYTSTTAMTSRDSEPQLSDRYLFGAKTWSPEYIEPLTTQHSTKTLNPRYKEPDQNEPSSKIKNNRDIELVKDKRTTSQQRPQAQTFRDVEECRVASEMKREYSPRDSHKQTELTEQINPREPSFHQRAPAQYGQLPCNVWTQNGQDHSNINMQVKQHSPSLGMQDRLHRVSIGAQDSYQSPNVGAQDRKLSHSVGTQDRQRSLSVGAQDRQHRIGGLDQTEDRQRSLSAGAQVGQHSFSAGAQDRQRSLSAGAQVGQHSFSAGAQDRQRSLSAGAQVGQHSFSAGAQVGQHSFSAGAQVGQHSLSAGAQDRQRSLSAGAQVGQHSFSAGAQDRQRSLSAGAQVGQHSFSAGAQVGQHSFSAGAQVGQHSLSAGAQDRQRSLSAGAQVGQHSLSAGAQDRQRSLSAGAQVGQHSSSAGAQDRKLSHSVGTQGRQHSLSVGDLGKQQSFSVLNQDRQNGLSAVDQGRQYNLDVGTQGTRHKPSFGAQDRQRSLSVGAQDRQRRHGVVDQTQDRQRSLSAGAQVRQHSSSAGAQDRQCSLSAGAQVGQHSFSAGAQDRKLSHSVGTQGRQHSLSVGDLGKQQSFSVLNQDRQNSLSAVDQGRQYNLNVGTQGTQHKPSFGAQGRQHSLSVGAQYGQCRNGVEDQTQYRQRSLSAGAQVRQHSSSAGAQDRQQSPFVKTHPRRESKQQPSEIIIQESSIDTVKLNSMRKTGSMEEMFGESWMRVANQNDTELYSQDNIRDMYDNCDMREVCDPEEKVGESAHKKIIYDKEYDQDDKVDQSAHKMVRNDKQYTRKVSVHWYPREQTNFKGNNRQQLTDISGQQDMEETQQIPLESRRLQSQSDKCEQQNESETNKHKMMSERTNRLSPTNKFKNKLCMQPTPEEADEEQSLEENIIKQSKREVIKPASMITLQQKNVLHTPKAQSPQTSITTQDPEVLTNKDNLVNESESRHFTLSENASEENKLTAKPTQDDRQLGAEETDMSHYLPKILTCTSEHTFIHQTAFKSVTEKQDQRIILKQEKTIIPKQDLNPEMDLGNKTIDENIAAQVTVNMERLQRLHRKKSEKLRQKIQALKKYQKNLIETVKENCRKLLEKERSEQDTQLQAERLSKEKLKEAVVALQTQLSNMEREVWQAAMSREVIIKDITRDRAEWEKNKKEMEDEIKKLRLQKGDMTLKMENVHQQVVSLQAQVNEATQAAVDADLKEVRLNNKLKNYHDLMEVCNSKFQQHRDNEMKLQSELELVNQKLKEQEKDVEKLKLQLNDLRSLAIRRRRKIENLKAKQASEHAKHLEEKAITARVEKEKKEIEDKLLAETLRHQQLVDLIAGQGKRLSTIRSKMETLDPNSVLNELQVRFQSELNFILRQVDNYLENQADAAEAADAAQKEKAFRQRAESGNLSILQYRHTHLRAMKQVTSLEENLLKALLYSAKSSPYESQAYDKNESFNLFRSSYFKTVPRERHSHLMENPQISAHVEKIIRPFSRHNDLLQNTYISQRQSLGTPNDLWQSRLFARTGTTSSDWNTAQTRSVAPKTQSFGVFTAQLQPGTSTVNKTSAEFSQEWTEQDTNTPSVHGGSFHSNHWIKQGTCTSGESILLKSRSVQDANTQHGHRGSITSCIEAEQITSTLHEPRQSNTSRQEAEQFANAQHGHSGIVTFSLQTDDDNINIPVGCDGNTRSRLGIEQIASPQFEHNSRSWAEIGVQTFRQDYSTDGKLSHSSTKLVVHEFTETALPLASKQDFSQMFDGAPQTECASEQCKSSVYTDNLHVSSDPQNLSKSNPTIIYCTSSTEPLLNVCPMYLPSAQRPSAVVSLCPPLLSRSWPEQVEEQCTTEISVWDTNAHSQNEPGIDIHQFLSTSDITSPNPMPCPCPGPFPQTRQTQDQPQTKSHPKSQGHIRSQNHPQTQGHPQSREHPQSHEAPFHTVRTFHPAAPVSQISQHSPYIELSSTSQPHPYVVSYPTPFAFGIPQHPYLVSHSTPVPTSSPWHHPHMVPCSVTYPCKFESQDGLKYERNSTNVGHYLSTSVHSPNVLKQDFPKDGIKLTVHNKSVDSFSPQDTSKTSVKKDDILKRDNERMVKRIHSTKNTVSASSSLETEKISLGKKYISSNKYRVKNDKNIKSDPIQETSSGTFLDSETQAERPSMFLETKESSLLSLSQEETESKPDDVPLSDCSSKKDPFTM